MPAPLIAITGKNGQLGNAIELLSKSCKDNFDFVFTDREELDITNPTGIADFFNKYHPAYFVHCAAYTAVDKAETDQETAYKVNAAATGYIAEQCKQHNCRLITISTDYVFDGNGTEPYKPGDKTDPVNYYGFTKWMGEKLSLQNNPRTIVIRTSWVYSNHGYNFVKTMLRLMKEREEISVVNDQTGSPTYAPDLAEAILQIINSLENGNHHYGIYHFSNSGVITWYEFAVAIRNMAKLNCKIHPIPTSAYPTPAKRPVYSVMDTFDIQKDFSIALKDWKQGLDVCIGLLHK